MKNIKVYKVQINSTKENLFILDLHMNDRINSHRYYCIVEDGESYTINRVKSIVQLLEYLEQKGIRVSEVSVRVKHNLISNLDKKIPVYQKKIDDNTNRKYNFSNLVDYDLNILKKVKDNNDIRIK